MRRETFKSMMIIVGLWVRVGANTNASLAITYEHSHNETCFETKRQTKVHVSNGVSKQESRFGVWGLWLCMRCSYVFRDVAFTIVLVRGD